MLNFQLEKILENILIFVKKGLAIKNDFYNNASL